jgi:hypothetical protein
MGDKAVSHGDVPIDPGISDEVEIQGPTPEERANGVMITLAWDDALGRPGAPADAKSQPLGGVPYAEHFEVGLYAIEQGPTRVDDGKGNQIPVSGRNSRLLANQRQRPLWKSKHENGRYTVTILATADWGAPPRYGYGAKVSARRPHEGSVWVNGTGTPAGQHIRFEPDSAHQIYVDGRPPGRSDPGYAAIKPVANGNYKGETVFEGVAGF